MAILRLARPMRRKGSRNEQFRQWIPTDILHAARGRSFVVEIAGRKVQKRIGPTATEVTLSLRTADAAEAKRRHAEVLHQFHTFCEGLRGLQRPIRLTHEESVRLAGDLVPGDGPALSRVWACWMTRRVGHSAPRE